MSPTLVTTPDGHAVALLRHAEPKQLLKRAYVKVKAKKQHERPHVTVIQRWLDLNG